MSDNFSFNTIDENGEEVINDVVSIIPSEDNSDEPYVVFTDYSLDDKDEFINKYGRLKKNMDGGFFLDLNLTSYEKSYIEKMLDDEIIKHVSEAIEENLNGW